MGRRLLIVGPPGAGKGTQAAMLARALGIPHVSTGEMLRGHVARGTELGKRAKVIMDAGDLVPDEIVIAMVKERLGEGDAQAEALDREVADRPLEMVLSLEVGEEEVVARLLKRAAIEGRSDDTEATVRNRLAVYRAQTEPLIAYYQRRGILRPIDGVGSIEEIFSREAAALAEA
jgi:adenylate kinase